MKKKYTSKQAIGIQNHHARKVWRERAINREKKCCACKRSFNNTNRTPTVDHIIPLSKGGKDDKSNWQLMCRECNKKKGNKMP